MGMRGQKVTSDASCAMREAQHITPHSSPFTPDLRPSEFWALQDINFDLKRGECLGLIGANGSGKSTLLRVLTGIFPPDKGEIAVQGRVGALIALGAGFHPHMTGRENIYLNGSILGLRRDEIDKQLEEIVDFAEIGSFIDAPVATYSSGMCVRLGFAVATAKQPDLLIVDEVLAVGDLQFVRKCLKRIHRFIDEGGALILVSHNIPQIQVTCTRGIYLCSGTVKIDADINKVANTYYQDSITNPVLRAQGLLLPKAKMPIVEISSVGISAITGEKLTPGCRARIWLDYHSTESIENIVWGINIYGQDQQTRLATITSHANPLKLNIAIGSGRLEMAIPFWPFSPGDVWVGAAIMEKTIGAFIARFGSDNSPARITTVLADPSQLNHALAGGELLQLTPEF